MIKTFFGLVTLTGMLLVSTAFAFEMEDSKLNLSIGKTGVFDISNTYKTAIAVKVSVEPETIKPIPANAPDCSKSVRIFPKIVRLEPGERQAIKFISRQQGYCRVFFEVDKDIPEQIALTATAGINTRYKIGIPVDVE